MSSIYSLIYGAVRKIPIGRVMTYGMIARVVGVNPRVVWWALHANKDKNVPCHRVVDRNGRLAPNYGFGGWREQRRRLSAEGVTFIDETHVDLRMCGINS